MFKMSSPTAAVNEDATVPKRVVRFMVCGALAGSLFAALLAMTCGFFFSAAGTVDSAFEIAVFPWRNEYVVMLAGYLSVPLVSLGVFCGATLAVANE